MGFILAWGKFSPRRRYPEKPENYPHAKLSTFTVHSIMQINEVQYSSCAIGWHTLLLSFDVEGEDELSSSMKQMKLLVRFLRSPWRKAGQLLNAHVGSFMWFSTTCATNTVDDFIFVGTNFFMDLTKLTHSRGSKFVDIVFPFKIHTENHYFVGTWIRGSNPSRKPRKLVPHENWAIHSNWRIPNSIDLKLGILNTLINQIILC